MYTAQGSYQILPPPSIFFWTIKDVKASQACNSEHPCLQLFIADVKHKIAAKSYRPEPSGEIVFLSFCLFVFMTEGKRELDGFRVTEGSDMARFD